MARARNIKPGFLKNEVLGVADPLYSLLFEGLWLLADREGRLEDRPLRIKAETFPYRDGVDVDHMLWWLHDNEFIIRYCVKGKPFIEVCNFRKHQNPHKNEPESVLPPSDQADVDPEPIHAASEKIGSTRASSLIPDSLNLIPESASDAADVPPKRAVDEDFEQFWRLYPSYRRKAKPNASAEWKIAKRKTDPPTIIGGLIAYLDSRDAKAGFAPYPAKWLKQEQWADEHASVIPGGNHGPKTYQNQPSKFHVGLAGIAAARARREQRSTEQAGRTFGGIDDAAEDVRASAGGDGNDS